MIALLTVTYWCLVASAIAAHQLLTSSHQWFIDRLLCWCQANQQALAVCHARVATSHVQDPPIWHLLFWAFTNASDGAVNETGVSLSSRCGGWVRHVGTQVRFGTLGSGHSRMPVTAMRMRWVVLDLSSRGVGYPAVVWLSRLWGDSLVSGSSKGKRVGIPYGPPIAWVSPHVFPMPHLTM